MTSIQYVAENFVWTVSRDQAGGAFGSAAVLRPAGSPLMPLRRTPHQPDLARRWVRKSWSANLRVTTIFAAEGVDWLLQRGQGGARRAADTSGSSQSAPSARQQSMLAGLCYINLSSNP